MTTISNLSSYIIAQAFDSERLSECIAALFAEGACVYFVGGVVRDALREQLTKDIDIEVHTISLERLQEILGRFEPVALVGKSFGVLRWLESGIDWSLPRTDSAGRHPQVTINPNLTITDALRRRDLTINALAVNAQTGELVDPFGGVADLKNKILRAPDVRLFPEDPLRFYRVMQFAARFGMEPDAELVDVCRTMNIANVAHERVAEEYEKLMLQAQTPSHGFKFLDRVGRLGELLPELAILKTVPQDMRWHPEGDVFEHTMQAVDSAAQDVSERTDRAVLVYSAVCHDVGKATTTFIGHDRISSHRHEEVGISIAAHLLKRMVLGDVLKAPVLLLVRWHMCPGIFAQQQASLRAYKRLAYRVAPHTTLRQLAALARADRLGRNPVRGAPLKTATPEIDLFIARALEAGVYDSPEPALVTGRDLLEFVPAGPKLGELVRQAYQIQIERDVRDKNELIRRVLSGVSPVQK